MPNVRQILQILQFRSVFYVVVGGDVGATKDGFGGGSRQRLKPLPECKRPLKRTDQTVKWFC
ncbi:MAG: hypothetical protein GC179_19720 [Anaerolineaceae bacterium]|nr:hypothetical protein [Anaerolineaceae bacterium]